MSCRWCYVSKNRANKSYTPYTAVSSERRAKLRVWAIWSVRAGCYSQAALYTTGTWTVAFGTISFGTIAVGKLASRGKLASAI